MTKQQLSKGKLIDPYKLAELSANVPVLLAFSGGADSMALLDMMQTEYSSAPILLAHVNHGIRGEEALRDRKFCEEVAKSRELEIVFLDIDIPALAKEQGRGLEETAREVRYAFFADLMKKRSIPLLLTAHHADDHLETLLFRIARGTGLSGLCGIAPIRPFEQGYLVRPMLGFSKAEILAYCQSHGISFVTDSTNIDTAYARNRIRADVIPVLESLYADSSFRSVRMSADLREDESFLCDFATSFVEENSTASGMSLKALQKAHPAIRRRALQMWFEGERGATLESVHLKALLNLIESEDTTARVALPTEVSAYCTKRGRLTLTDTHSQPIGEYKLPLVIGESQIPNTNLFIRITPMQTSDELERGEENVLVLLGEWKNLEHSLVWRNRREGDVILRGKMHRRLRRLWAERGVPTEIRRTLPLLCKGEEILWAPFVGMSDSLKKQIAKGDTSSAYKIEINVPNNAF